MKQIRCPSGVMGWKAKLQAVYKSKDSWISWATTYGLHRRLNLPLHKAWDINPMISGSVNPSDFRVV